MGPELEAAMTTAMSALDPIIEAWGSDAAGKLSAVLNNARSTAAKIVRAARKSASGDDSTGDTDSEPRNRKSPSGPSRTSATSPAGPSGRYVDQYGMEVGIAEGVPIPEGFTAVDTSPPDPGISTDRYVNQYGEEVGIVEGVPIPEGFTPVLGTGGIALSPTLATVGDVDEAIIPLDQLPRFLSPMIELPRMFTDAMRVLTSDSMEDSDLSGGAMAPIEIALSGDLNMFERVNAEVKQAGRRGVARVRQRTL